MDLHIPGEHAQVANGRPLLVSAVIHLISVTTTSSVGTVKIIAHHGVQRPDVAVRNETNYYEWQYDNGTWADLLYGRYIDINRCTIDGPNTYVFAIGISDVANVDFRDEITKQWSNDHPWNLTICLDGIEKYTSMLSARMPDYGIGGNLDHYTMVVPPFSTNTVRLSQFYPASAMPYVLGADNIPVTIRASCDILGSQFVFTNISDMFHIGDIRTIDVIFTPPSGWSPRRNTVKIQLNSSAEIIASSSMISLKRVYATEMQITVEVKRADYELLDLGNGLMVEYRKGPIAIPWTNQMSVSLFMVGNNETVDLEISGDNLTILSVNGAQAATLRLDVTNDAEREVNITIKANVPDTAAFVVYKVRRNGVQANPFYTQLRVGPGSVDNPQNVIRSNWIVIAALAVGAIIAIALAIVYMQREKARKRERARMKRKKGGRR